MLTCLSLLLRELHIVEDPEHNAEQILPPVFLVGVTVRLHHLKHHRQTPDKTKQKYIVGIGFKKIDNAVSIILKTFQQ